MNLSDNLLCTGNEFLVEYQIMNVWMDQDSHNTGNLVKVTIVLRRRVLYHLGNTFLQILMLLMIGYLSLYFDVNKFSDRIMVALTTLLVLATMMSIIQGVSI